MQIGEAREQYVRWLLIARDLSPHTIRAYEADIAALERHLGAGAVVNDIVRERLIGFMEEERVAGLASSSLKRRASGLRGFCRWSLSRNLLESDPWAGVTIALGRSRTLPRFLPRHELKRLLGSLRASAKLADATGSPELLAQPHQATTLVAVTLMVTTGVRVNEAVSIRPEDVDLHSQTIQVVGKGRRERQVPLANEWIRRLLGAYLETRRALGVQHSRLLFNARLDPLTASAVRLRVRNAAKDAELSGRRLTPHMLRHTAATQLIEAGVDIRVIQRLLGHASLSTTEIYTHVSDQILRRVVSDADVLGGLMRR